jgi:hypothetical protein
LNKYVQISINSISYKQKEYMTLKFIIYKGYRFRGKNLPTPLNKKISTRANYIGKRFSRSIVIECLGNEEHGYKWWGLQCDCGTKFAARSRELAKGHTQSCGCLQKEIAALNGGSNRLAFGEASMNELFASYIKSSTGRNYEWGLSKEEFKKLVTGNCVYCGILPNKERKPNKGVYGGFMYTGIDRIDNNIGYIKGNVVSCCWDCNRAKGSLTVEEFLAWIKRIEEYKAARSARFEHGESGAT